MTKYIITNNAKKISRAIYDLRLGQKENPTFLNIDNSLERTVGIEIKETNQVIPLPAPIQNDRQLFYPVIKHPTKKKRAIECDMNAMVLVNEDNDRKRLKRLITSTLGGEIDVMDARLDALTYVSKMAEIRFGDLVQGMPFMKNTAKMVKRGWF